MYIQYTLVCLKLAPIMICLIKLIAILDWPHLLYNLYAVTQFFHDFLSLETWCDNSRNSILRMYTVSWLHQSGATITLSL